MPNMHTYAYINIYMWELTSAIHEHIVTYCISKRCTANYVLTDSSAV
jgi:hypothetical protein